MRRGISLLLLLLLAPSRVGADDPGAEERKRKVEAAKKGMEEDRRAFEQRVNEAIDRGIAWLRTQQRQNGSFPAFGDKLPPNTYQPMDLGVQALVLLTFAKSGVGPEDKAVERLNKWMLVDYAKMKGYKKVLVYPAATMLMALEALYHPAAKDESDVVRDRYGVTVLRKKTPCRYPPSVAPLVEELAKFLIGAQVKVGGWRYPSNAMNSIAGDVDVSNTQYALLGLNAAARCGTNVPLDLWMRAMEWLLKVQEADGLDTEIFVENSEWEPGSDKPPRWLSAGKRKTRGWCYLPGSAPGPDNPNVATGAMTCAGLAGLAVVKERLGEAGKLTPELGRRLDSAMLDGFAWLSDAFTVTDNPVLPRGAAMWHYYYLYGLERVGSLTGIRHHAKQDWYRVGAEHLLGAQEKTGGWKEADSKVRPADSTESAITQTCFALLFLKRATTPPSVPVTPPVLTKGGEDAPTDGR